MKVIIVTSQRSGSTFLYRSLNSHPQVTCEGELLIGGMIELPQILADRRLPAKIYRYVRARAWNPVGILNDFLGRSDSPVVGFKAMYNHLKSAKVIDFLRTHSDIRIIHLRRDNLLKQYVSKATLGKKRERRWQPHSTTKLAPVSTRISPDAAIAAMEQTLKQFEAFERLLSGHQKIELVYEEMIDGGSLSASALSAICGLLDIEKRPMVCDYVKTNPNDLELIVENYAEVVKALRGSKFERHL